MHAEEVEYKLRNLKFPGPCFTACGFWLLTLLRFPTNPYIIHSKTMQVFTILYYDYSKLYQKWPDISASLIARE